MASQNENREIAIKVSGVKKMYKLGQIGGGTLQADLQSWWARVRGKEDPNSKIGTDQRSNGKTFMALNGLDLTVYKGEALGIIGGNGAGKSTMLKLLSRVTAPTEGEIDLYGRIASMLEVGTGFNPEMTGRENVYLNGAILGMTKAEIDAKMEQIIEFSEVREFIDTPVKRYSSGMFVKLAFSVAAHLDSEIMIMDEVLAVGDMAFQSKCLNKMKDAAKQDGRTVLYVSHNMNTIRTLCDRCIVLDKGKIIFEGDVEEAISLYMSSKKELSIVNDFASERNSEYNMDNKVHIDQAVFIDKEYPVFEPDEDIIIKVSYTATEELSHMAFRMTIMSENKEVVGLATTKSGIRTKVGKNEVILNISANCLAPCKYIVKLVSYSANEYGYGPLHDAVDEALAFQKIMNTDSNNKMNWNHKVWGYMMFPEIIVKYED